jgi:predicted O-methyltransferase YrrM
MTFKKEQILKRLSESRQKPIPTDIPGMDLLDYIYTFIDPELEGMMIGFTNLKYESGNISFYELFTINSIARCFTPKHILEFGTFNGRTTGNMAINADFNVMVYTVDLPKEMIDKTKFPLADGKHEKDDELGYIGREDKLFIGKIIEKNITQIWDDTANITKDRFDVPIDFIFVDASHSYENALNDSKTALDIIYKKRGLILWHDYGGWPGVTKALNQIFKEEPEKYTANFRHIINTSIVVAYIDTEDE